MKRQLINIALTFANILLSEIPDVLEYQPSLEENAFGTLTEIEAIS
ncbi:MAG: hypothetical protein PHD61_03300 [Bacteroidales bacterium]|nr:hypothetical protein [Lentimicrobiaceae bacterium]MDD5694313.1 hypothetical protein [Bacteroidales bacterium]